MRMEPLICQGLRKVVWMRCFSRFTLLKTIIQEGSRQKTHFVLCNLALDQITRNNAVIELALTASDIERINKKGKIAAFLDLEGGFDLDGDINLLRALYRLNQIHAAICP